MAERLVARRPTSLFPKGVRYYERYSDPGGGIPNASLRSGGGGPETGQGVTEEGDVHGEKGRQVEHVSRVLTESVESRELAHPDAHARWKGKQ